MFNKKQQMQVFMFNKKQHLQLFMQLIKLQILLETKF
jgi:hypothetical protein